MKDMRVIDDKIIYALNTSIPTASFKSQVDATEKCTGLHEQILNTYDLRQGALNACINFAQEKVSKAAETGDRSAQRMAQTQV